MKTFYTKRRKRKGKILGTYFLPMDLNIVIDFGAKEGKLKLGTAFIADAIEFYIEYCLKELINATKVRKK